jgi:hypothetical protein
VAGAQGTNGVTGSIAGENLKVAAGSVLLLNTILADSPSGQNCSGAVSDGGHNLSSDASCNFTNASSLNSISPRLGPLADNGGPTLTMALLAGSPALDAGDDLACPPADQRGIPRPQGSHCDIGALEVAQNYFRIFSMWRPVPTALWFRGIGPPEAPFRVEASSSLGVWEHFGTGQTDPGGTFTVAVPLNVGLTNRFYRIAWP